MEEDDLFLDDGLDGIPDNTLLELERNAISSTQRQKPVAVLPPANLRKQAHNASSLNRSQKSDKNLPWRPPQRHGNVQRMSAPPASAPEPPSSDYGFDDENVIDLDEPSMIIQPASGPQSRAISREASQPLSRGGSKAALDAETAAAFAAADAEMGVQQQKTWAQAPHLQPKSDGNADMSALQARIAALEAEQIKLKRAEQDARDDSLKKTGEISMLRAKQEKANKENERRLSVMQKLHSDESAKHKAELEATRKEREKIEMDNRFLQHDLAQEADRMKRRAASKPGMSKEKLTPRKAKRQGLGDGFEDDEVLLVSPSRSREKSRDQTPKAGSKRKRSVLDQPIAALSFTQPSRLVNELDVEKVVASVEISASALATSLERERYDYVQRMLNHRQHRSTERTIELLAKYHFPSTPRRSLASVFFDGLALPFQSRDQDEAPLRVSRVFLRLWASCLDEKIYTPLGLVLDMLRTALSFELSATVAKIAEEAIPLCLRSIDLVVTNFVQASQYPSFAAKFDYSAHEKLAKEVEVDEVVDFLQHLAESAALSNKRIVAFWRCMHFTHTLLMLHKAQPIPRIIMALQILNTSSLEDTFGPISEDPTKQKERENATLDRLTSLLSQTPEAPRGEKPYRDNEVAELRIQTLSVLRHMCLTDHGGMLLAGHRYAIGRLVRFLHEQVCKLYVVTPSIGQGLEDLSLTNDQPSLHLLIIQTVNTTVRLLHHVLRTYDSSIDLTQKLAAVYGGYHKFLISMTRVAFSEQLVLEQGIENEVIEAAHEILDNVLSPEEGEAIVKAVETPRGTRSTTTRQDAESQEDAMDTKAPP